MAQKVYTVEGRQFRTEGDYARARHDKEIIDKLRRETDFKDKKDLEALRDKLRGGGYKFMTLLGQDFLEEVEGALKATSGGRSSRTQKQVIRDDPVKQKGRSSAAERAGGRSGAGRAESAGGSSPIAGRAGAGRQDSASAGRANPTGGYSTSAKRTAQRNVTAGQDKQTDSELDAIVEEELERREHCRKLIIGICSGVAVICLGYFGVYSYFHAQTDSIYQEINNLKDSPVIAASAPSATQGPLYTLDEEPEAKEVLEEYKNLLIRNKRLIGWIKIDDTNINYPVLQAEDNEYYLDHNIDQEYDVNGSIFMDKDCDVLKPSTNYILYGHHMRNGMMFGKLDAYQKESYYLEHPYINFDTIYEKGTYQVMYVFRSRVYKETEIVFKYYQFIDANSEKEFDSNMKEMAAMSLYDTGVTAKYGDQLLTLSTCDYQETDGRFVVVAKKIAKE